MAELAEKLKHDDDEAAELSLKRVEDARRWLRDFYRTEGLDKTGLARRLGLGKEGRTIVARFLGDANADSETNYNRVTLATERLRALVDGPEGVSKVIGYKETRSVKIINNHLARVRDDHLLGAIVGPYGAGKSYALRKAKELSKHDGKAPIRIVRCRVTMNLAALVTKLAIEMGMIQREKVAPSILHEDIVRRLAAYPEFLIFDEVDHLTHDRRCLEFIRDLHDETGTGILVCGQMYFLSWVWEKADFKDRTIDDGDPRRLPASGPMAPFADRLTIEVAPGLDDSEVVDITEDAMKAELSEEASKRITAYINHDFRALCDLLRAMRDMRLKAGKVIDHQMVERAWSKAKHIKAKR